MALWQGRSRRKPSGGRLRLGRKKRKFEIGTEQQFTYLGPGKRKLYKVRGGNIKTRLLQGEYVNVVDPDTNKVTRAKIITVRENPANPNYVQRNIINKGAVVLTEIGEVRITSRPSQHGVLNGVLLK